jgi:hypothetical protein
MQSLTNQPELENSRWADIAPWLDAAMAGLGEADHSAIVLRFFEGKDYRQVGAELGVNENAAKTRVSRAVEKLRRFFVRRGIMVSGAALAETICANSVQAAPAGVAPAVTAATAKGSAVAGSTVNMVNGTLELMAGAKMKTAVLVVAAILLAAGSVFIYECRVSNLRTAVQPRVSQGPQKPPVHAPGSLTFESFFLHSPNIWELVFDKQFKGQPTGELTLLRLDSTTNVMLCPVTEEGAMTSTGVARGWFDGYFWNKYAAPDILAIADPKENPEVPFPPADGKPHKDGGPSGLVEHTMFKKQMGDALSLGFREIDRSKDILWDKSAGCFTASTIPDIGEPAQKVKIELNYENGVPVRAACTSESGDPSRGKSIVVYYKYTNTFCNGLLPVEYKRFVGYEGGPYSEQFTVRFKDLQVSERSLARAEMDPHQILQPQEIHIWHNNVAYSVDDRGEMKRVLTGEQATEQTKAFREGRPIPYIDNN